MESNIMPSQTAKQLSDDELNTIANDRLEGLVRAMAETRARYDKAGNPTEDDVVSNLTIEERKYILNAEERGATLEQSTRDAHINTLTDRCVGMMHELDKLEEIEKVPF